MGDFENNEITMALTMMQSGKKDMNMTDEVTTEIITSSSCHVLSKNAGDCYFIAKQVDEDVVLCNKCLIGQLIGDNTLLLPPVLVGKNAQQVFSALGCLNFNSYQNSLFYVDFSRVERVDSGGIGALILLRKKIVPRKIEICLTNIKSDIYRTFSMCNFNKIFMLKR